VLLTFGVRADVFCRHQPSIVRRTSSATVEGIATGIDATQRTHGGAVDDVGVTPRQRIEMASTPRRTSASICRRAFNRHAKKEHRLRSARKPCFFFFTTAG